MSPLLCLVLAERKGRLLLYQPLLHARSFRHFPFNLHSFSMRQKLLFSFHIWGHRGLVGSHGESGAELSGAQMCLMPNPHSLPALQ